MKVAHLRVDETVLRQALHLPDDVEIVAIDADPFAHGCWYLRLAGERFADVSPGRIIPPVRHMLTETAHACGHKTVTGELS